MERVDDLVQGQGPHIHVPTTDLAVMQALARPQPHPNASESLRSTSVDIKRNETITMQWFQ